MCSTLSDIIEWLEKCIRTKEVLVIAPIREVLQQLIRSIKNLCNIQEDEVMGDEILKEIFSDTKCNSGSAGYEFVDKPLWFMG